MGKKQAKKEEQLDLTNATYCEKHYSYNGKNVVMYLTVEYTDGVRKIDYTSETDMLKDYKKIISALDKTIPNSPFTPGIKPRLENKLKGALQV